MGSVAILFCKDLIKVSFVGLLAVDTCLLANICTFFIDLVFAAKPSMVELGAQERVIYFLTK